MSRSPAPPLAKKRGNSRLQLSTSSPSHSNHSRAVRRLHVTKAGADEFDLLGAPLSVHHELRAPAVDDLACECADRMRAKRLHRQFVSVIEPARASVRHSRSHPRRGCSDPLRRRRRGGHRCPERHGFRSRLSFDRSSSHLPGRRCPMKPAPLGTRPLTDGRPTSRGCHAASKSVLSTIATVLGLFEVVADVGSRTPGRVTEVGKCSAARGRHQSAVRAP